MYDELLVTIGSRRSSLHQNLALKSQYDKALQDLADLLDTGQEKMAGDQKIIVSSKEAIQQLLGKHKVRRDQGNIAEIASSQARMQRGLASQTKYIGICSNPLASGVKKNSKWYFYNFLNKKIHQ